MIDMVLITHGQISNKLIGTMEYVVGLQKNSTPIYIAPDDNMNNWRADILTSESRVQDGTSVVVLNRYFHQHNFKPNSNDR